MRTVSELIHASGLLNSRPAHSIEAGSVGVSREEWSPPKEVGTKLRPVPTFIADTLLPEPLRAFVVDEAERMPCPPEYVATAVIAAIGSVVGSKCGIRPKTRDPWIVLPNLWGAIVGDPSSKKSPALNAALDPLNALAARAKQRHQEELKEFHSFNSVFDLRRRAIQARLRQDVKDSDVNPEVLATVLRDHDERAPKAPVMRRFKSNDSTVEKLGELLRDNPAGLLVLRDELVGLLTSWDRKGHEGDRAFFLEAWDGTHDFETDRIGRGNISIHRLCLSIFGGIQPDKLFSYLKESASPTGNDGLLQRFQLLVFPDECDWDWCDCAPNVEAQEAMHRVFVRLSETDASHWGAAPCDERAKSQWFRFDADAQELFVKWVSDLHRNRIRNEGEPLVRQHLLKYEKLFPALALIFHLVERAVMGGQCQVSEVSARYASAWCDFLESHARRCYSLLTNRGQYSAQALAEKLSRGCLPEGFTVRDVLRKQWRGLTSDGDVRAAIETLTAADWIRPVRSGGQGPGTGRPTDHYQINPHLRLGTIS